MTNKIKPGPGRAKREHQLPDGFGAKLLNETLFGPFLAPVVLDAEVMSLLVEDRPDTTISSLLERLVQRHPELAEPRRLLEPDDVAASLKRLNSVHGHIIAIDPHGKLSRTTASTGE